MRMDWRKLAAVAALALALAAGVLVACQLQEGKSGLLMGSATSEGTSTHEHALEGSDKPSDAQAGEDDSGDGTAGNAVESSSEQHPTAEELLIIEEQAPVPDTWVVEEFGKMADRQRRLVVNSVDDETYRLLVEKYGEEEVARCRDDDGE